VLRHQLPAYSPITWGGIGAGVGALLRGDRDGSLHRRVAEHLRSRYDARAVVLTDSGTSALRLAIAGAIRGRERQPVALPGYCCYDVATAAEGANARVALYDLDINTLGPDLQSLDGVMALAPAAVVIVHLYGLPVDVGAVRSRIGNALLIEDAAQGVGGSLDGKRLGSSGSVSVLSFGRGKGMTGGGGGALLAHDDHGAAIAEWAEGQIASQRRSRGMKQVAQLAAQRVLGRPALYGIPSALPFLHLGETLYHPPRPPAPAPAATLAALERLLPASDREAANRRVRGKEWLERLRGSRRVETFDLASGAEPGYLRFPVRITGAFDLALLACLRAHGVMPGYPSTLIALSSLSVSLVRRSVELRGCKLLAANLVTLPTHSRVGRRDALEIAQGLDASGGC
jgi:perosamine synthetase